jgi:hypothetical protein
MNPMGKAATRRDLLYLLAQASELEHSLACQYLFTAFSLKQRPDEGVTAAQLAKIRRWRQQMISISIQEMLHLALASNLLTAIGGAPYFRRANFPQAKTYTSLSLRFVLAPFNEQTIKRYICFELPQNFEPLAGENNWNEVCAEIKASSEALFLLPEPLLPKKLEYHTIGELYELIRQGFVEIEERLQSKGKTLFIGSPNAQATQIFVDEVTGKEQLFKITDVASAHQAIDLIIEQGEGTPRDQENNHFRWFMGILTEYLEELSQDPMFQPARPVIENPLLDLQHDHTQAVQSQDALLDFGANVIVDELSRDIVEIFGATYEVMLQILARFFAHTVEDEEQLYTLKSAFLNLMSFALSPLGDAVTQLPAGEIQYPGRNAGPSFEVFSDVQLLPQMNSAWPYFRERLEEISAACDFLINDTSTEPFPKLRNTLLKVSAAVNKISYPISFEPNGLTWSNGISQLFSPMDVDHMKRRLVDLDDYEFVKTNVSSIHDVVKDGFMPKAPLGAWTSKRVEFFKQWIDNGFPE